MNWVPTPEGFHGYAPVIHAAGDYLPGTVPWDKVSDLMTPQMRTALGAWLESAGDSLNGRPRGHIR